MTHLRAVFLAAGFATRLYPLTRDRAKPLLEIGGVPMLTRLLRQVEALDAVRDGVVVTNARFHADFVDWAEHTASRLPLDLVDDGALDNDSRLGAVRDLALALERPASPAPDGYLVMACDNLVELDLPSLVARFTTTGHGQLIVREVPEPVPPGRYSEVTLDGDRVASFREKPGDPTSSLSAIAIYLLPDDLPSRVSDYLATGGNPDAPGHFLAWLADRAPLGATRLAGRWIDIGNAEDLTRARAEYGG